MNYWLSLTSCCCRFNHIQSEVFDTAYNTSENMLICAPTGAGKTNIALLTYLQLVKSHMIISSNYDQEDQDVDVDVDISNIKVEYFLNRKAFKGVYIAPMKALAQEVVTKFSKSLKPLGIEVREFTG